MKLSFKTLLFYKILKFILVDLIEVLGLNV
jgi:hypothetical protein